MIKISITSGFDGIKKDHLEDFIKAGCEILKRDMSRPKGGNIRYDLKIAFENKRATLTPNVSTGEGMEKLIIWNIADKKGLTKIVDSFTKFSVDNKAEIVIDIRPYLWFGEPPSMLPGENK